LVISSGKWNLCTAFSGISGKEASLPRNKQIFENFSLGISVPFDFLPGMVICISGNQQFLDFLETFQGNFHTICPCFESFRSFGQIQ